MCRTVQSGSFWGFFIFCANSINKRVKFYSIKFGLVTSNDYFVIHTLIFLVSTHFSDGVDPSQNLYLSCICLV